MGNTGGEDRSERTRLNQIIFVVTHLINLSSTSANDKENETCFFAFQEKKAPSSVIKYPLTNL